MSIQVHYCFICSKEFSNKYKLFRHNESFHTGEVVCEFCNEIFENTTQVSRHIKFMRHIVCSYCDKNFSSEKSLNRHLLNAHDPSKAISKCPYCSRSFIRKYNLDMHIKRYHLKLKFVKCELCNKEFFSKRELLMHMKNSSSHRKEEEFVNSLFSEEFLES
jgi:KRAB domain-containing zinc finger protein